MNDQQRTRCWGGDSPSLMREYHDTEWGTPLRDDLKLFEYIVLDAFQAGLNWSIIMNKRENFRNAFDNFDPGEIARYRKPRIEKLLRDKGIIRNRLKVEATVTNAKAYLELQEESGGFNEFIWSFVDDNPIINRWNNRNEVPAESDESRAMSKALKERGFKFVGPTICYAFMQAAGLVNDHLTNCFRHQQVSSLD